MFEDIYYLRGKKEAKKSALSDTHTHTHTHTYIYPRWRVLYIVQDGLTLPRLFLCLFYVCEYGIDRIEYQLLL